LKKKKKKVITGFVSLPLFFGISMCGEILWQKSWVLEKVQEAIQKYLEDAKTIFIETFNHQIETFNLGQTGSRRKVRE